MVVTNQPFVLQSITLHIWKWQRISQKTMETCLQCTTPSAGPDLVMEKIHSHSSGILSCFYMTFFPKFVTMFYLGKRKGPESAIFSEIDNSNKLLPKIFSIQEKGLNDQMKGVRPFHLKSRNFHHIDRN